MKFQGNTVSKPVAGQEAKRLAEALSKGEALVNAEAQRTIDRILAARQRRENRATLNGK